MLIKNGKLNIFRSRVFRGTYKFVIYKMASSDGLITKNILLSCSYYNFLMRNLGLINLIIINQNQTFFRIS